MTDTVAAQLVSFDLDTADKAVLSFSIKGTLVRLALAYEQVGIIKTDSARAFHAMTAAREKTAQAVVKPDSDTSMQAPD